MLTKAVEDLGASQWTLIAKAVEGRTNQQCKIRWRSLMAARTRAVPVKGESETAAGDLPEAVPVVVDSRAAGANEQGKEVPTRVVAK